MAASSRTGWYRSVMSESSPIIGCAVCALPIEQDDEAIELLSTVERDEPMVVDEPTIMHVRPAYAHAACGIPADDVEVRHDLMRGLRPAEMADGAQGEYIAGRSGRD